jgi:2-C-methyl-D-erythritol 4-phosphate cytidylyltransferase
VPAAPSGLAGTRVCGTLGRVSDPIGRPDLAWWPSCLAIVPVDVDDRSAPLNCAALRELRRRTLLSWSVVALTASGVVGAVVVAVPPALEEAVTRALPVTAVPVQVVPVQANGPGHQALAALRSPAGRPGTADVGPALVVVHDPLHPLSSAALVRNVVRSLLGPAGAAASVPAQAVTDTLKWVGEGEVILDTADREAYRMIYSPQAYRREALTAALAGATDEELRSHGSEVLPGLVRAGGGRVTLVPSPGQALRVATHEDLVLAEALLHVDAGVAAPAG